MQNKVMVLAGDNVATSKNQATIILNALYLLRSGQFQELNEYSFPDDNEFAKVYLSLKELSIKIMEERLQADKIARYIRALMEYGEDREKSFLKVC